MFGVLIQILLLPLPWALRRPLLHWIFGFRIARSARIGRSVLAVKQVDIGERAAIGHLNMFRGLSRLEVEAHVVIGHLNWIGGTGAGHPVHYADQPGRDPAFIMRCHASLSSRHHFDCTDRVEIGAYSVIAGMNTQILTHGIDVRSNRQLAGPVTIGAYCFVGSRSMFLKDTSLPSRAVLAAGSVVARNLEGELKLFGGVPAKAIGDLPEDTPFFTRQTGFVA